MAYHLRNYLDELRERGELLEIDEEVDWRLEAAAIITLSARMNGPVLLFNNIKGYPEGYRLVSNVYAGQYKKPFRRLALAIGLDPNVSSAEFLRQFGERFRSPIKPVEVSTGRCKEVIKTGKDVNLFELPWPYISVGDGGRYSLSQAIITKDPDTNWVNWGNYRTIIHSRNRCATNPLPGAQINRIYEEKYQKRGKSMPIAIALGGDPTIFMVSGASLPEGVSEADVAGGLRGAPLELVRCETSDLLVPADAEIVIEGEVRPYERLPEGPEAEAFLFQSGPRGPAMAIRVHCVSHWKDPILPTLVQTHLGDAQSFYVSMIGFAISMPLMMPPFSGPVKMGGGLPSPVLPGGVISTAVPYEGFLAEAASLVFSGTTGMRYDNMWFIDEDVDPTEYEQVYEEIFANINPKLDIHQTDNWTYHHIVNSNWIEPWDRDKYSIEKALLSTKRWWDCRTKNNRIVKRATFETCFPEHIQKWVVENWEKFGFKEEPMWNKAYQEMKPRVSPDEFKVF